MSETTASENTVLPDCGLRLGDVIGWEEAQRMLDQAERFEFGRLALVRATLDPQLWYVYFGHTEAHVVLGEPCQPFPNLNSALHWALSPATLERLEAATST